MADAWQICPQAISSPKRGSSAASAATALETSTRTSRDRHCAFPVPTALNDTSEFSAPLPEARASARKASTSFPCRQAEGHLAIGATRLLMRLSEELSACECAWLRLLREMIFGFGLGRLLAAAQWRVCKLPTGCVVQRAAAATLASPRHDTVNGHRSFVHAV